LARESKLLGNGGVEFLDDGGVEYLDGGGKL
jgi:hypothetical protein